MQLSRSQLADLESAIVCHFGAMPTVLRYGREVPLILCENFSVIEWLKQNRRRPLFGVRWVRDESLQPTEVDVAKLEEDQPVIRSNAVRPVGE